MSFPGSGRRQRRATSPRFRFFSGAGAFCFVFSSVLFFVVCRPGCVFSCFFRNFFACVYVFVFQGCAVCGAGVLLVGGIKKFEKSHGKVWLFGLSVVLLHSLSGTKRRRKAEPGGGSSMIVLHKR